jgi:hypothetical protein
MMKKIIKNDGGYIDPKIMVGAWVTYNTIIRQLKMIDSGEISIICKGNVIINQDELSKTITNFLMGGGELQIDRQIAIAEEGYPLHLLNNWKVVFGFIETSKGILKV